MKQVGQATASLNVSCATAIVLHQFCEWAKYEEAPREGQKFVVDGALKLNRGTQYAALMTQKKRLVKLGEDGDQDAAAVPEHAGSPAAKILNE